MMKKSIAFFLVGMVIAGFGLFAQTAFAGIYDPVLSVKVTRGSLPISNGSTVSVSDIQNKLVALLTVDPAKKVTKWTVAISEGFSLCDAHEVNNYQYQATICLDDSGLVSKNTAFLTAQAQGNGWTTNKISFAINILDIALTPTVTVSESESMTAIPKLPEISPIADKAPILFRGFFSGAKWLLIPLILAIIAALFFLVFHRKKIFHFVYFVSNDEPAPGVRLLIDDLDRSRHVSVISDKEGRFYLNLNPGQYLIKIESENIRMVNVDLHPEQQIIGNTGKITLEYANESLKIGLDRTDSF